MSMSLSKTIDSFRNSMVVKPYPSLSLSLTHSLSPHGRLPHAPCCGVSVAQRAVWGSHCSSQETHRLQLETNWRVRSKCADLPLVTVRVSPLSLSLLSTVAEPASPTYSSNPVTRLHDGTSPRTSPRTAEAHVARLVQEASSSDSDLLLYFTNPIGRASPTDVTPAVAVGLVVPFALIQEDPASPEDSANSDYFMSLWFANPRGRASPEDFASSESVVALYFANPRGPASPTDFPTAAAAALCQHVSFAATCGTGTSTICVCIRSKMRSWDAFFTATCDTGTLTLVGSVSSFQPRWNVRS